MGSITVICLCTQTLAPHGGEADEGLYALLVPPAESLAAAVGVLVEERHAREGLPAAGARVLLGLQVRLQVRAQVRLVGEGARAVRARERLLARVRPAMKFIVRF